MPRSVRSLPDRIVAASKRARQLSPLTGGLLGAARLMIAMRLNPGGVHSVQFGGRLVHFRPSDEQALKEVLVDDEYGFLAARLGRITAPIVLDIGAHIGTFALSVSVTSPNARVTCVEADPATYQLLDQNFRAQHIAGETLNRAAASGNYSTVRFSDAGPSMSHRVDANGNIEIATVSLRALVDGASNGGHLDLAKIDVEGSEEALICDDPEVLARIDAMVIELHPQLCDAGRVRAVLSNYYPRLDEVAGRTSTKPLLYCQKDSI